MLRVGLISDTHGLLRPAAAAFLRGCNHIVHAAAPTAQQLQTLVERISARIGRQLERGGILVRDAESSHLALEADGGEDALAGLQGHSITYRVAFGARQGQKAFTLQTLAPRGEDRDGPTAGHRRIVRLTPHKERRAA